MSKEKDSWFDRNREHYRKYQRDYRRNRAIEDPEFKERVNKHSKNAAVKNPITLSKYGKHLTEEQRESLKNITACQICNADFLHVQRHFDHDHATARIRGVLCRSCNSGLGFFKDNTQLLQKAASYLLNCEYK